MASNLNTTYSDRVSPPAISGPILSTTVIIVIAVAAFIVLCLLACLIYRCAKRRSGPPRSPAFSSFTGCSNSCDCGWITKLNERAEASCGCCQTSLPTMDSLWEKCCPKVSDTPDCTDCIRCKGMHCPKWASANCVPNFLKDRTNCGEPSRLLPKCCRYDSDTVFCAYGNGDCRLCCLECKVRTRQRQPNAENQSANSGVPVAGAYPIYPPGTAPIYTMQPGMYNSQFYSSPGVPGYIPPDVLAKFGYLPPTNGNMQSAPMTTWTAGPFAVPPAPPRKFSIGQAKESAQSDAPVSVVDSKEEQTATKK